MKKFNFKKHAKIVFLVRTQLNKTEVFISKSLADSYISHAEFVSTNNVLMCEKNMMKLMKKPEFLTKHSHLCNSFHVTIKVFIYL